MEVRFNFVPTYPLTRRLTTKIDVDNADAMNDICIVLVEPQGDANIGACARAMKNFGVTDLRLVNPVPFKTRDAFMWAVDARDIVESAREFNSLKEAIADVSTAAAFTRRIGKMRRQHMNAHEAARKISETPGASVALIFGREDSGLSNDEIKLADFVISIPSSTKLPSLNLAQSVLIACYEIFLATKKTPSSKAAGEAKTMGNKSDETSPVQWEFVNKAEVNRVLSKLDTTLRALGYEDKGGRALKSKIINHFDRLFGRAGLTARDLHMFEGLFSRVEKRTKKARK